MMKALVRKPSANRPVLNSTTKNAPIHPINNKSSSSSKPPLKNISTTASIKPPIPKDVGVLKRTSVSKPTKK
jgi:hypothetical protein